MLVRHEKMFQDALWKDLRRNQFEASAGEVLAIAGEALYARDHVRSWMRPKHVKRPLFLAPGRADVHFDPLGVCLIIGTWNFPFLVTLSPLIAAISAGNCAVIKSSEVAPASSQVLQELLPQYLDNKAFSVVSGGASETTMLLEEKWDHIFFTGSPSVGKIVMQAAAKNLTPVVLELGGKNPTIVHSSANLRVAARRIAQGRWMNAGQSCTAPDYVFVSKDVKDHFLEYLVEAIHQFYGKKPSLSPDYGRIVNMAHFDRLIPFLKGGDIYHGGYYDRQNLCIEPTILVNIPKESTVMQEEIFGPILPVLEMEEIDDAITYINNHEKPLAISIFSEEIKIQHRVLQETTSGSLIINDCAIHPLVHELPFGGVGASGMGKYHGEWGFRAYTNARGVLQHSTLIDCGLRYPPYDQFRWLRDLLWRCFS
jgi:acyl-CoA reductase-like NAD-dependent aldehyde dehydrogenase